MIMQKNTKIPVLDIDRYNNDPDMITVGHNFDIFNDTRAVPITENRASRINPLVFSMYMEGKMELAVNMERYSIAPGDMVFIRPNDILQHFHRSDDFSAVFIAINAHSTLDIISQIKRTLPTHYYIKEIPPIHLEPDERLCIAEYYRLLKTKAAAKDNPMRREIIINIMRAMIYDLIYILQRRIPHDNSPKGREDQLTELFIRQMENSFREHRDVAYYADKLCLTPKYLSQMVKKATGRTAGQWIDYRVILEAKVLLQTTDMTVQQISQELNFPNQSFFGKYFKNLTGISPQKYRKE